MPSKLNKTITITDAELRAFDSYATLKQPALPGMLQDIVFLGDCVATLHHFPDECIDLIIADPPYLLNKDFGQGTLSVQDLTAYAAWVEPWVKECARILKPTGTIYICTDWLISGTIQTILDKYFHVHNRITWKRDKGRGAKANWKNNSEDVWYATKTHSFTFNLDAVKIKKPVIAPYVDASGKPKDWFEEGGQKYRMTCPSNLWTDITVPFWSMPENTEHPTQKPEKLIERLMLASSLPGDLVLDPFMGSGTVAVVAKRLNRHYTGCEIEKRYYLLTLKRLGLL